MIGLLIKEYKFSVYLFCWIIFTSCQTEKISKNVANLEALRKNENVSESHNINFSYSEKGLPKTIIAAPHVIEKKDSSQTESILYFNSGILVTFFSITGEKESTLTAKRAEIHRNNGYAVAEGSVVVKNMKGEQLETEKLIWKRNNQKISTGSGVRVTTKEDVIIGDSLEANTSFTKYKIFKIRGTFKLKQ